MTALRGAMRHWDVGDRVWGVNPEPVPTDVEVNWGSFQDMGEPHGGTYHRLGELARATPPFTEADRLHVSLLVERHRALCGTCKVEDVNLVRENPDDLGLDR